MIRQKWRHREYAVQLDVFEAGESVMKRLPLVLFLACLSQLGARDVTAEAIDFGELLAQNKFLDFACDRHREFFNKEDVARNLEI